MNPPEGYHKSNEAHDWEKPARIHQGQITLDKPDHLLRQSNLLSWCGMSGGRCLLGFLQGFQYSFPQPPPRETDALRLRQVVHAVHGEPADRLHPESGDK